MTWMIYPERIRTDAGTEHFRATDMSFGYQGEHPRIPEKLGTVKIGRTVRNVWRVYRS